MKTLVIQLIGFAVLWLPAAAGLASPFPRPRPLYASHELQLLAAKAMVLAWCADGKAQIRMGGLLGAALWRVSRITRSEALAVVADPNAALRMSHEAVVAAGLHPG